MPSAPSSPPSGRLGILYLAAAIVGWGLNWPAIKLLLEEWPPLFARGSAGLLGAALMANYARLVGESLAVPGTAWPRLLWLSFTNVFAWMGFATVAMVWLGVAEGALLAYTMPLWTTLLAWPVLGTRPTARTAVALVLSFSGIALILAPSAVSVDLGKLPGVLLMVSAAILFALGTVTARAPLPLTPVASTAWQVGLGCMPMLLAGLALERHRIGPLTATGWITWTYMALGPMTMSYLAWFAVLRRLPPATAASAMLLVPVVGVVAAALILGDPLGLRQVLAMVLTLGGVALALRQPAR